MVGGEGLKKVPPKLVMLWDVALFVKLDAARLGLHLPNVAPSVAIDWSGWHVVEPLQPMGDETCWKLEFVWELAWRA